MWSTLNSVITKMPNYSQSEKQVKRLKTCIPCASNRAMLCIRAAYAVMRCLSVYVCLTVFLLRS